MGRIHRLEPIVANQIAAGEVVERTASVVKELIENSLDAGAHLIDIRIDEEYPSIEVRDDGEGIEREDLPRSIERHSTSKLTRLEDLEHAHTLGFRGEALAAIASVSELTIASRSVGAASGFCLDAVFGHVGNIRPHPMNVGTRVSVSHIFAQQPARLKAMKTPASEFGAIQHTVQQLAIDRPDVQMRLSHDGRSVLETPGRGDAQSTLLTIFGRDLAADLLAVNYESESGWRISGYVAPAHRHRANRFGQGIFINGRWVTNWQIRAAVEEAFRPNIPDRRFPYFWLWIDLAAADVDPNAHPTKSEVRLAREQAVRALVYRVVKDVLKTLSPAPQWSDSPAEGMSAAENAPESLQFQWTANSKLAAEEPVLHQQYRDMVPLAQWRAKYIIAHGAQGLCLIDQHAAHERIFYERFKNHRSQMVVAQPLLIPLTETLSASEWAVWTAHQTDVARWGFEVASLGGTTVAVRAVPAAFHDLDTHQGLLRTVLELLSSESSVDTAHPVSWAEDAYYAMAACKAAIKANRPMSMLEMQSLLQDMGRVEDPRGCPHGRPTMWVLTLEEVDRRFGRRGH